MLKALLCPRSDEVVTGVLPSRRLNISIDISVLEVDDDIEICGCLLHGFTSLTTVVSL